MSDLPELLQDETVEIELDAEALPEDGVTVEIQDDGGALIDFDPNQDDEVDVDISQVPFNANLAEFIDDGLLGSLGSDLYHKVKADETSREEWMQTYKQGLQLLGLTTEDRTEPWPNACGVFHPVLIEAVVRFQAQAIMELFPPKGPVKTEIIGRSNAERDAQAERVRDDMNYIATQRITGYRDDTENLLLNLPFMGSAFRKVYGDQIMRRPAADFIAPENFIMPFNTVSLEKAERYTHAFAISMNELRKKQLHGIYRDVETAASPVETTEVEEAKQKIQGQEPEPLIAEDDRQLYEIHTVCDLPEPFNDPDGIALPYIITIDKTTFKVLSIYRNWKEEDQTRERRLWFAEYKFMPGLGAYGLGLIHLIGGLTKGATSLLRQLVDAGELANLPGGYKTTSLRTKGDDTPIGPGEWRDVDVSVGKLSEAFFPMPYKEPSNTLFQLMVHFIDEARRVGSVADTKISDMSAQAPVGTTFALLERSLKVQSAVQARLHASMKAELKILQIVIWEDVQSGTLEPQYPFDVGGDFSRLEDYDDRIDVIPVSDPNAATTAQRVLQNQAAIQLSEQAPDIYDQPELHRSMLKAIGFDTPERFIPPPKDVKPRDPVTENMDILNAKPVRAGMEQDHEAHIAVHKAILDDPQIGEMVQNTPQGPVIAQAAAAHIQEHLAFKYRQDIERAMGVGLPPAGEPLPADIENNLAQLTAQAADKVLQRSRAEFQRKQILDKMQDPVVQQRGEELEIKRQEVQRKAEADRLRAEQDAEDRESRERIEIDRIVADLVKFFTDQLSEEEERKLKAKLSREELSVRVGEILRRPAGGSNDT